MDILTQAVADSFWLHLKDASGLHMYSGEGEGRKPVRVHLYSPGSDAIAQIETKQTQRFLKRMDDNDGKRTAMSVEERTEQTAEDLADATIEWENLTLGDKTGRALSLAIYGNRKLGFLANQVSKALVDWGNAKSAPPAP